MDTKGNSPRDPLKELIITYNELNSSTIEELDEEPSPLEFMRYVSRNTPFVVRGAVSNWEASLKWTKGYLDEALEGQTVNVAVTPHGNADSPALLGDGRLALAKPHEENQIFSEFLSYVIRQEKASHSEPGFSEVRYAQTQNDNLRNEYITLFSQVQKDIPFARIALQKEPDAINLWVGNSRSVTALHKDNYENIYVQIRGRKHFVLLPPVCHPCVNEQPLRPATYVRRGELGKEELELRIDDESDEDVPFATWDPDQPDVNATAYSSLARPVRVTLGPTDMLYLPAMWYHKVSQSTGEGDDGFVLAVNYWYDMEFGGPLYPLCCFVRSASGGRDGQPK